MPLMQRLISYVLTQEGRYFTPAIICAYCTRIAHLILWLGCLFQLIQVICIGSNFHHSTFTKYLVLVAYNWYEETSFVCFHNNTERTSDTSENLFFSV